MQQRLQLRQVGGFTPQSANWRPGQLPLGTGEIFFPVGRSFGPTANRQTAHSWHFNCFSETPALMPCSAHGTAGAPSEPLARQSSSSQVTKKVAIVSVVTEIDPSGENPQLWYTTHAVSPEARKTVKLSQGRHIDGIIGVPVSAPLRELTAALGFPTVSISGSSGSRDSDAAKPKDQWSRQVRRRSSSRSRSLLRYSRYSSRQVLAIQSAEDREGSAH